MKRMKIAIVNIIVIIYLNRIAKTHDFSLDSRKLAKSPALPKVQRISQIFVIFYMYIKCMI